MNRFWRIVAGIALLITLGLGACGQSSDQTPTAPAESFAGDTVPPPTTITTPSLTAEPSPEQAAEGLLAAWRAGDRVAAGRVAPPASVDVLFSRAPGTTQGRQCSQGGSPIRDCVYRLGNELLRVKVAQSGEGWVVDSVELS